MALALLTRAADSADDSADDADNEDAEALATAVAASFLLTDDEVASLSASILTARLASWRASYTTAATTAGARLPAEADGGAAMPSAEEKRQRREADAAAASIAATYARDLASQAAHFLQNWLKTHDGSPDPLDGAEDALRSHLADYAAQRGDTKGAQVGQYETGVGANDGTAAAVDDLESGDLLDDATGDPFVDLASLLYVVILPDDGSPDFCFDYAGNCYSLDDAPGYDWPAHNGCIHYAVLITAAEFNDGDAPM